MAWFAVGCGDAPVHSPEAAPSADAARDATADNDASETPLPELPPPTDLPGQSAECARITLLDHVDWTEPRGFVASPGVVFNDTNVYLAPESGAESERIELPISTAADTSLQAAVEFVVEAGALYGYFKGRPNDGSMVEAGWGEELVLQGNPSTGLGALVLEAKPGSRVRIRRLRLRWCESTPLLCDSDSCATDDLCRPGFCNPLAGCGTADLHQACDDGVACTVDRCSEGACIHEADDERCPSGGYCQLPSACDPVMGCSPLETLPECCVLDSDCDDGLGCNGAEVCQDGTCVSLDAPDCSDGEPCNGEEQCDEILGCVPGAPLVCDDDNICNGIEVCQPWTGCEAFGGLNCDDGNSCTLETCDPQEGCRFEGWIDCSDGDICNGIETCDSEQPMGEHCVAGVPLTCDDGLPCTGVEQCDPALGCVAGTALDECCTTDADCNDQSICTGIETCVDGTCQLGESLACSDQNPCNGTETCDPVLGCQPSAPLKCDNGSLCDGVETCDPTQGCIAGTPLACDDGNPCNGVEGCVPSLGCTPGEMVNCEDGNLCNGLGFCEPGTQACATTPPLTCDDGLPCNGFEGCDPTTGCTVTGAPPPGTCCTVDVECDNGNLCNGLYTCDVLSGACVMVQPPLECDGDVCLAQSTCNPLLGCVELPPLDCDDGDICTLDTCDSENGGCLHTSTNPCDDGDTCTTDLCSADGCEYLVVAGCCVQDTDCDDQDICTADQCDVTANECIHTGVNPCDDGAPCTEQVCVTNTCTVSSIIADCCTENHQCDDDDACTTTGCSSETNTCFAQPTVCSDDNPCTIDTCHSATGCDFSATIDGCCNEDADCDSGTPCLTDVCDGETHICTSESANPCDDGNPCTTDACELGGCVFEPIDGCCETHSDCNDGTVCNGVEACVTGTCETVAPALDCDDQMACSADACDPELGCQHAPVTCDDGNPCNGIETCQDAEGCVAGTAPTCGEGGECSGEWTCVPDAGCVPQVPPTPGCCTAHSDCDDANPCNGSGYCELSTGTCILSAPPTCDDGDPCNGLEHCVDGLGCTAMPAPTCAPPNVCLTSAGCGVDGCEFAAVDCDDDNLCTVDHCDPQLGCQHTALSCEDNTVCNGTGYCDGATGLCAQTTALECDDGLACNGEETCDPVQGCQRSLTTPVGFCCESDADCDDGDPCNGSWICNAQNSCSPNAALPACDDQCGQVAVCTPFVGCEFVGPEPSCTDDNPCTADSCDAGGCVHTPMTTAAPCADVPVGKTSCAVGTCVLACPSGTADVDGLVANGCEVELAPVNHELWVDGTADGDGDGSFDAPFLLVGDALAAADALKGSVAIYIRPGTYDGAISVARPQTTLQGIYAAHETAPVLFGTGAEDSMFAITASTVAVRNLVLDTMPLEVTGSQDTPVADIALQNLTVRNITDGPTLERVYGIRALHATGLVIADTEVEAIQGVSPGNRRTSGVVLMDCELASLERVHVNGVFTAGHSVAGGSARVAGIRWTGCDGCSLSESHVEAVSVAENTDGIATGLAIEDSTQTTTSGTIVSNVLLQDPLATTAGRYVGVFLDGNDWPSFGHEAGAWNTLNGRPLVILSDVMGTEEAPVMIENLALDGTLAATSRGNLVVRNAAHVHLKHFEIAHQKGIHSPSGGGIYVAGFGATLMNCADCVFSHSRIHHISGADDESGLNGRAMGIAVVNTPVQIDHVLIHDVYPGTATQPQFPASAVGIAATVTGELQARFVTITRVGTDGDQHRALQAFSGTMAAEYAILDSVQGDCVEGAVSLQSTIIHGCTWFGAGGPHRVLERNPRFVAPDADDFRLQAESPAVDYGLWNGELACSEPGNNGCVPNSGAYGGTAIATHGNDAGWRGHCPCDCGDGTDDCWPKAIYVSDNGTGAAAGDTIDTPIKQLSAAVTQANAGDWIGVMGSHSLPSDLTQSDIRLVGLGGNAILQGPNSQPAISIDAGGVRLEDFTLFGTGAAVDVRAVDAQLVRLEARILSSGFDDDIAGIRAQEADGLLVDDCSIKSIQATKTGVDGSASGIWLEDTQGATIRHTTIDGITAQSCNAGSCEGGDAFGIVLMGSSNNTLTQNTVTNLTRGTGGNLDSLGGVQASLALLSNGLSASTGNTVTQNLLDDGDGGNLTNHYGHYGVFFDLDSRSNDLGTGETLNRFRDQPVHYYSGVSGTADSPLILGPTTFDDGQPTNLGQFIVHDSAHVRIEGVSLSNAVAQPGGTRYFARPARGLFVSDCVECRVSKVEVHHTGEQTNAGLGTDAVGIDIVGGRVDLDHVLVTEVSADQQNGAAYALRVSDTTGAAELVHATLGYLTAHEVGAVVVTGATASVALENSIIASVTSATETTLTAGPCVSSNAPALTIGALLTWECTFEGESIAADPQFVDAEAGNYQLSSDSPAVDGGTGDWCGEPDADGCAPNLGYYGATPQATSTPLGAHCGCETF